MRCTGKLCMDKLPNIWLHINISSDGWLQIIRKEKISQILNELPHGLNDCHSYTSREICILFVAHVTYIFTCLNFTTHHCLGN